MLAFICEFCRSMSTTTRRAILSCAIRNSTLPYTIIKSLDSLRVRQKANAWPWRSRCPQHPLRYHPLRQPIYTSTTSSLKVNSRSAVRAYHSYPAVWTSFKGTAESHIRSQKNQKTKFDRDLLLGLLDQYDEDPFLGVEPALSISNIPSIEHTNHRILSGGQSDISAAYLNGRLGEFQDAVRDASVSLDELYDMYRKLPQPNVLYVDSETRSILLHRFSVPPKRTERAMLRYLSLLEDVKQAGIPISLQQWNSAVHLVGRSFGNVTSQEVEAALRMWKEMEQQAGITSNVVTFNILFDVASKSGQFVLADMIMEEMRNRNVSLSRFSHVGLIYYHGLKADGAGVRQAYRSLIKDDQLVDSLVLNCVIASFLRAGELPAAMNVYARMKSFHNQDFQYSYSGLGRASARDIGQTLSKLVSRHRDKQAMVQELQNYQSLSPDVRTYIILVQYHVSNTGELQTIANLLDEMHEIGIPLDGRLFLEIFRGFSEHGDKPYTLWTTSRLQDVWDAFMVSMDSKVEGVYVAKWISIWILRAFAKCCGHSRSLDAWKELKDRWDINDPDFSRFERDPIGRALSRDKT